MYVHSDILPLYMQYLQDIFHNRDFVGKRKGRPSQRAPTCFLLCQIQFSVAGSRIRLFFLFQSLHFFIQPVDMLLQAA